jgi:hypothetical protein
VEEDVCAAEALLIHSHAPAFNSTYIKEAPSASANAGVRVLNWGAICMLSREVSGLVWTQHALQLRNLPVYEQSALA